MGSRNSFTLVAFVLLVSVYTANASAIGSDVARQRFLLRQLLDEQSGKLNTSAVNELSDQIQDELDHMKTNARSYLAAIRDLLMNFACRIGITRFCVNNDLPVAGDLPDVPPFPNDFPKSSDASGSPIPKEIETKPEEPKALDTTNAKDEVEGAPAAAKPPANGDIVIVDALPPMQQTPNNKPEDTEPMDPAKLKLNEPDSPVSLHA